MKIGISGTHGVGKTFSVYEKANEYKLKYPDKEISIICEIARRSPFPINEKTTLESQQWMFTSQIKAEMEEEKTSDIIITDRSLADYLAYAKEISEEFFYRLLPYLKFYIQSYDIIIYKTIENNPYHFNDGVRSMDKDYRKKIEDNLLDIYENKLKDYVKKIEYI